MLIGSDSRHRGQRGECPRFADSKAYWYWLGVDDTGHVWLSLDVRNARYERSAPRRYWVLSPEGELLGETTTPGYVQIARGHAFSMREDPETGEIVPTVYRMRPAVDGFDYRSD